jgi:hypothetical protein
VPALNIFESSLKRGKFDASRELSDGSLMQFAKVYPMDAVFDAPEDVPEEVTLSFQRHFAIVRNVASMSACAEHEAVRLHVANAKPECRILNHIALPHEVLNFIMCKFAHSYQGRSVCTLQVAANKRYAAAAGKGFTVSEVARSVERDFGKIDIVVHSLANGPEVTKPLLETSRKACTAGYAQ